MEGNTPNFGLRPELATGAPSNEHPQPRVPPEVPELLLIPRPKGSMEDREQLGPRDPYRGNASRAQGGLRGRASCHGSQAGAVGRA